MISSDSTSVRLTVIVPGVGGWAAPVAVLRALQAQSVRPDFEVLLLTPGGDPPADQKDLFDVAVDCAGMTPYQARVLGVRRARGQYVVLAEDHCLPDPGWAEALLSRLQEDWDAVGCALRPGNPASLWAQASFLLGYGEWLRPLEGQRVLPGHNVVIRRSLLLNRPDLEGDLVIGSLLMRELQAAGARSCLESGASMAHFDCTSPGSAAVTFLAVGAGFGGGRSLGWSWWLRWGYALAAPLIGLLHWRRALRHYFRAGRSAGLSGRSLVVAAGLAFCWGLGEALGAILGRDRVAPWVEMGEINRLQHVHPSQRP